MISALISELDVSAPGAHIRASPIEGTVETIWPHAGADVDLLGRVRAVVSELQGTLTVNHCNPDLKRRIDVFGDPPPSFPLMRAIKQQFDPNGILSPGRFVGRL
jgi:FAD/FMN-containing dehydrogenase